MEAKSSVEDVAVCSHVVMHVPLIVEKMFPLKIVVGQNLNGTMFYIRNIHNICHTRSLVFKFRAIIKLPANQQLT